MGFDLHKGVLDVGINEGVFDLGEITMGGASDSFVSSSISLKPNMFVLHA